MLNAAAYRVIFFIQVEYCFQNVSQKLFICRNALQKFLFQIGF
jgi:hypothetical protein